MASTQSNLHQFYKARKSARDTTSLKNAKNSIVSNSAPKLNEISEVNAQESSLGKSTDTPHDVQSPRGRPSREANKKFVFPTSSIKKSEKPKASKVVRPAGTQNIASVFERVAAKRKRQDDTEDNETISANSLSSEEVHVTPPATPKRKKEGDDNDLKRPKKHANEEVHERTPNAPDVVTCDTPKSAKKKLMMGAENFMEREVEKDHVKEENAVLSPRKMLSPRKLTPAEIKERLGRCGRLDQLRSKLLKVNQCGEKLKQFKENQLSENFKSAEMPSPRKKPAHPQLQEFSSLDVEVPISPKKTPIKTPTKTPVKAPAYQRYDKLIAKPSEELTLPYKYRIVKEAFRAVDTVVSLLHNRQEVITFSKLKSAVQEMLRKAFSEQHLGEIKTVFPLAYIFKQDITKNVGRSGTNNGGPKQPYQLTVEANMGYKPVAQNLMSRFNSETNAQTPRYRKMDSVVLVERRNIFHNSLIGLLREHHSEFLKSLDPPIVNCDANIKRWHPSFPLEDVPEIEPAPLPQPPVTEVINTAHDLLNKAQDLFSVNPRLEKAVMDSATRTPTKTQEVLETQPKQSPDVMTALKGVSSSLLEKIRAKEAAKAARDMTRTTGENKELAMLSRLAEISRIIRNIFVTEKKAALPWETVATKVAASYPSMLAGSEVDNHLNLLIKEVPGWCTIHKVRSGIFLKINKNEPQSNINDKLQAVIKERR